MQKQDYYRNLYAILSRLFDKNDVKSHKKYFKNASYLMKKLLKSSYFMQFQAFIATLSPCCYHL